MAGSTDGDPRLGATERCLREDLAVPVERCALPLEDLRHDHEVIGDFLEKRSRSPEGAETIRVLSPSLIAYSLHTGRYRSATWWQKALGLVWLLATAIHRDDSREDAYRHFERLHRSRALLPVKADVERVVAAYQRNFAEGLLVDVPALIDTAHRMPDAIHEGVVGGRVRLRVAVEDGILTVAVCNRVLPGEEDLPREWLVQLLAAFFGDDLKEISYCESICGSAVARDEQGFCSFAD